VAGAPDKPCGKRDAPLRTMNDSKRQKPPLACLSSWPSCSSWFNCFFQHQGVVMKIQNHRLLVADGNPVR
jgi:hypothetical protein